ncbi:hypothetical protein M1D47_04130 [Bacillus sp. R1-10]
MNLLEKIEWYVGQLSIPETTVILIEGMRGLDVFLFWIVHPFNMLK